MEAEVMSCFQTHNHSKTTKNKRHVPTCMCVTMITRWIRAQPSTDPLQTDRFIGGGVGNTAITHIWNGDIPVCCHDKVPTDRFGVRDCCLFWPLFLNFSDLCV